MEVKDLLWGLAVIQSVLAAIFFLLGFATSHWYVDGEINFGLWESCNCTTLGPGDVERYHGATRAFQIICMLGYLLSVIFFGIDYRLQASAETIVYKVLLHITVVSHFVSVVVFGVSKSETGWSFDLSATALTLCALGLALVVLGQDCHGSAIGQCGAFLLILTAGFFFLSFATSHWYDDGEVNFGLWESCICTTLGPGDVERYHGAMRAFQIISMVCYLLSAMFYGINYRFQVSMNPILSLVCFGIAFISHFVSVIVLAVSKSEAGWSFALSATALILCVLVILGKMYCKTDDYTTVPDMQNPQAQPDGRGQTVRENGRRAASMNQPSSVPPPYMGTGFDCIDNHNARGSFDGRPVVPTAPLTTDTPPPSYGEAMAGHTRSGQRVTWPRI